MHEAAHGVASPADAGATNGAAAADGDTPAAGGDVSTETPAEAGRAAKRMKVAAGDDVSSRAQPQLAAALVAAGGLAASPAAAAAAAAAPAAPAAAGGTQLGVGSYRRCELPPSHYVLTLEQLQEHGYPLPQVGWECGVHLCTPAAGASPMVFGCLVACAVQPEGRMPVQAGEPAVAASAGPPCWLVMLAKHATAPCRCSWMKPPESWCVRRVSWPHSPARVSGWLLSCAAACAPAAAPACATPPCCPAGPGLRFILLPGIA